MSPDEIINREEDNDVPESELILHPEDQAYPPFATYAAYVDEKRELKARLKKIEDAMRKLAEQLEKYFEQTGVRSLTVGDVNIHLYRSLYARPKEGGDRIIVSQALKANGLERFVQDWYDVNTLSKYVRDLEKEHWDEIHGSEPSLTLPALLPAGVAAVLDVEPTWDVRGRRAPKKSKPY